LSARRAKLERAARSNGRRCRKGEIFMPTQTDLKLDEIAGTHPDFANGSILFIGTATVIIRYAGFTILTDPNFLHAGDHVHLGYGMTSERLTEPALNIEELPPLDFCVLSHYHGDHFDQIAEERLDKDLFIISTAHATAELTARNFKNPVPVETWDTVTFKKGDAQVKITALPGQHGPGAVDFFLPPVMGSMLEFGSVTGNTALRLYISGDTLVHEELKEIPQRYPNIDLGLFHLGGTMIMGVMLTMDAEQGVEAVKLINPREAIPIHYNDYDVFKSPLEDFKRAAEAAGLGDRMRYLSHGETYDFTVPASRLATTA
jgi:L-ascorbate metabolism protein UlaG (beta-lactamase superfamily)